MLAAGVFLVAMLYSCVGHGGASGYMAVMVLFGISPIVLKPTALVLNILVSTMATLCFARAGHFSWRLFWPFAITSIPCSFVGGYINLPPHIYRPLVGVVLLVSAFRLFFHSDSVESKVQAPPLLPALTIGAGLGILSGLTGVGGGIFLSPLLVLTGWGRIKEISAVSALFILVNSISGLLGHLSSLHTIPSYIPLLASAAVGGGVVGSILGSHRLQAQGIVRVLSIVLTIAGFKLILT
jgi:uncharacterized membrane protein YfcA